MCKFLLGGVMALEGVCVVSSFWMIYSARLQENELHCILFETSRPHRLFSEPTLFPKEMLYLVVVPTILLVIFPQHTKLQISFSGLSDGHTKTICFIRDRESLNNLTAVLKYRRPNTPSLPPPKRVFLAVWVLCEVKWLHSMDFSPVLKPSQLPGQYTAGAVSYHDQS